MCNLKLVKFIYNKDFELFKRLVFNEAVMKMNYGRVFTLEEAEKCYKRITSNNEASQFLGTFKILDEDNNFIGLAALDPNKDLTEAEIEYMLLPEYWNKGYGTYAIKKLLEIGKQELSINKISAFIDPGNSASKKVLIKNGFVKSKHNLIEDGSIIEIFIYKICERSFVK